MQARDRESYFNMFQWIRSIYETEFPDNPTMEPERIFRNVLKTFL